MVRFLQGFPPTCTREVCRTPTHRASVNSRMFRGLADQQDRSLARPPTSGAGRYPSLALRLFRSGLPILPFLESYEERTIKENGEVPHARRPRVRSAVRPANNALQRTAPGVTPLAALYAIMAPHVGAQGARHPARR